MRSIVLGEKECARFYRLRDALADYAYDKLGIEEKLYIGRGKKYSDQNMYNERVLGRTLELTWDNPSVIDDFISENPASLKAEDIEVLKSWRINLHGHFLAFVHDNSLQFLWEKTIFKVSGLWEDIDSILDKSKLPMMVDITLLPFEERVVYDGFISYLPISMGKGMRDMLESLIKEALAEPVIIESSEEFVNIVPIIKEKEQKNKAEHREHEARMHEESEKQMKGTHKGMLSGLTEQERNEAIESETRRDFEEKIHDSLIKDLKSYAIKGPVTGALRDLISKEPKELFHRWSLVLGIDVPGKGTKSDLIQALLPELSVNPFLTELTLRAGMSLEEFDKYRNLFEEGGRTEVEEDEIKSVRSLPPVRRLLCYSFYIKGSSKHRGRFAFVIPDEIMAILSGIEWDEIRRQIVYREAAVNVADAVVELRGLAKVDEVFDEFCRFYPSGMEKESFEASVRDAIAEEQAGCVWLEADDGNEYLLDYDLADYYLDKTSPEDEAQDEDDYPDNTFLHGPFEPLEFIEEQRRGKRARPLEESMLSSDGVYDWKCNRAAVLALRDYLDSNVPDSMNDFYYADAVIEELIDYMASGIMSGSRSINDLLEIMESHDYVPNEAHLNRLINLLMNMHNALPSWINNGWAPDELADAKKGQKSFYNEDGTKMKVGRNDPCPCGSGKKYKHCCGRIRAI